ncbi:MAG: glycoside hydrolase family 5 protein [Cyanobacteria bacterium HKST-UBA02]|nr:glycoside hydrolase family 5 protein [Cyanobacteria bacterium HKST-UBA02]
MQTSQPGDGQDRTQVSPPEQAVEDVSNIPWTPLPDAGAGMTLDAGAIRGVNLSGAEWGKNGPNDSQFWPTAQELDYYKSKGMNSVRLPISWEQFQPQLNGQLDPNEMNRLLNFLHEADARGMKVVLDLQNFDRYKVDHGPFGQGVGPDNTGTVVGQPGVPVSALADFWSKMVRTVDADPSASAAIGGWDLMNEPHDDGKTWVNTATQVVDAIRATGDQHTIIVEGDEWARDFTGFESLARSDKNIVFSAHSYWDDGSGGYSNQNPAGANVGVEHIRDFVNWLHQNNAQGFVGEWGVPTNNPAWDPAVTNFLNYLKANNVGHMVWSGGPGWNDYGLSVEPSNGQDKHLIDLLEEID